MSLKTLFKWTPWWLLVLLVFFSLVTSLEGVDFSFGDKKVFDQLALDIQAGDKVLVTGPSGSGKSTLLGILHGYLRPQEGRVRLQANGQETGQPLTHFDSVAIIQQTPVVFNETVRFNLTFSDDPGQDAQLMDLLRQVNLADELGDQPLDKVIEEGGANLSGGQKQRIEIARALYQKPAIIFVDEMTSALDFTNAQLMRDLVWDSPATVIEIAHHYEPQLVDRADKVIKL